MISYRPASLAKTTRPTLAGVVPRERLFALLQEASEVPVTWITGPPGSGKTTTVASYLDRAGITSLWYQLDEGDTDVATFFYYLRGAAEEIDESDGEPLPLLTPEYHGGLALFTRRYFQMLFARLKPPFAVVFDGYQEIPASSELHDVMRVALRELPPGGRVIIVSRGDPPASFARLRASRAIAFLGWEELRLNRDETAALVARRRPVGSQTGDSGQHSGERAWIDDALDELHAKTQGWAAGLVLMLEQARTTGSITDPPDPSTRKIVFDYLAGELFDKSDTRTQEFLVATSFLPQMTEHIARELTGDDGAGEILADLYRNNYFVSYRPARPEPVYQYHPMFREFLLARAQQSLKLEGRRRLQGNAATLLEESGQVEDAIALCRESREWTRMALMIEEHAASMLAYGRGETVLRWVEELPLELQQERPWTLYWAGASQVQIAPRKGRLLFEEAFERFSAEKPPARDGMIMAASGAMDAILYELDDFALLDRWIAVLDEAAASGAGFASPALEARVSCSMVFSLTLRQPHRKDIAAWIERAIASAQTTDDVNLRMFVRCLSALSIMWAGAFPQARGLIDAAQAEASSPAATPFSRITLYNVIAMFHMLTANREQAQAAEEAGIALAEATGVGTWTVQLLVHGYGSALAADDLAAAAEIRARLEPLATGTGRLNQCLIHHFEAWEAALRDDMMLALQHEKRALTMAVEVGGPYFEVLCRLALAQILAACGDERKCVAHLRRLRAIAREIDNKHLEFTCLLSFAQIALENDRQRPALAALRAGLELGRQYGYRNFLWWRSQSVAILAAHALEHGIEVDYVRNLVRIRELAPEQAPLGIDDWPWTFRVQTLGAFRITRHGEAIGETGKAQRRPLDLLRLLIACEGEQISKEQVADALWPRIDGDSAQRSLTTTLHRLRKLLGDPTAVLLREGRLALNRKLFWVDAWAMAQAGAELDNALKEPDRRAGEVQAAAIRERIRELHRGPFLAFEVDAHWATPMRERLQEIAERASAQEQRVSQK